MSAMAGAKAGKGELNCELRERERKGSRGGGRVEPWFSRSALLSPSHHSRSLSITVSSPNPMPMSSSDHAPLHKEKHIRYWLRCLRTYLPNVYTSNDAQRMTFAFFILSALDLLGALHTHTTASERTEYKEWILRCQHPDGGFRGFTGTMVGEERRNVWDTANIAATYFACAALLVLGEGIEMVRRRECLAWIRGLQRENGSFAEERGKGGSTEGAEDMRFCYLATGTRWILRRGEGVDVVEDIDVDQMVQYIKASVVRNMSGRLGYPFANYRRHMRVVLRKHRSTRHMVRTMSL